MKLFKSRKTYYRYNPNTLDYERVYPSAKDRIFSVLRHLSTGIAFGIATFFVMMYVIDSPRESQLQKENRLLQTQYEVLDLRLNNAMEILDDIQQRDENLYRAIFQAESIPESIRKSGFGGTNRYKQLMEASNSEIHPQVRFWRDEPLQAIDGSLQLRTGGFDHPQDGYAPQAAVRAIQLLGRTYRDGKEPGRADEVYPCYPTYPQ